MTDYDDIIYKVRVTQEPHHYHTNETMHKYFAPFDKLNSSTPSNNISDPIFEIHEYIFDRTDIRAIFITLYSIVFCCCFFGNLLVILVVTLSRRLRSITNFFLANLALADLCVGVFCVFQNLSIYIIPSWVFGDFLCKMYQFIHSLSYTASIFILVVICTERYFAIIHPITCKQILTPSRLRMVIVGVWITSAIYSCPKFILMDTIVVEVGNGQEEIICAPKRTKYDSELFDIINFVLLYVIPLFIMTVLYTRIAIGLWRSARSMERRVSRAPAPTTSCSCLPAARCNRQCVNDPNNRIDSHVALNPDKPNPVGYSPVVTSTWRSRGTNPPSGHLSHLSQNVLRARRGVIRMLIIVVLTFAICNLPFHARKMWQYWSTSYEGGSNFSTLLTPLTFLISYFNSGINPLLYAFLSRNFRKGMKELLFCNCRGSQKKQKQKLLNQQGNHQQSMLRRSSTRSTRAPCSTVTLAPNGNES